MSVDQQFTALYEKLQQLLKQHNRLEREVEKLQDELKECRVKETASQARAEELQPQIAILKLAAGEMTDKDKKVFDRKLKQYIKEIDKVIAHLSV